MDQIKQIILKLNPFRLFFSWEVSDNGGVVGNLSHLTSKLLKSKYLSLDDIITEKALEAN